VDVLASPCEVLRDDADPDCAHALGHDTHDDIIERYVHSVTVTGALGWQL
jgi:hypothetical protein